MPDSSNNMPPPVRFLVGICELVFGFLFAVVGSVFRVFPVTSMLGSPVATLGYKLCYNGGADVVRGIGGTFGMIGRASSSDRKSSRRVGSETDTDQLFPPPK